MLKDTYFMNKYTGELLPGMAAIHQFYAVEKHKYNEAWTDEWQDTGRECENDYIPFPDFAGTVKI